MRAMFLPLRFSMRIAHEYSWLVEMGWHSSTYTRTPLDSFHQPMTTSGGTVVGASGVVASPVTGSDLGTSLDEPAVSSGRASNRAGGGSGIDVTKGAGGCRSRT